jgi:hypothetical protein
VGIGYGDRPVGFTNSHKKRANSSSTVSRLLCLQWSTCNLKAVIGFLLLLGTVNMFRLNRLFLTLGKVILYISFRISYCWTSQALDYHQYQVRNYIQQIICPSIAPNVDCVTISKEIIQCNIHLNLSAQSSFQGTITGPKVPPSHGLAKSTFCTPDAPYIELSQ